MSIVVQNIDAGANVEVVAEMTMEVMVVVKHDDPDDHPDHENLHAGLFVGLLLFMAVSQIGLYFWKERYPASFTQISLLGLWLIPITIGIYSGFWRFVLCWLFFTFVTAWLTYLASQKPLNQTTPRNVYKWFYFVYKVSYGLTVVGYVLLFVHYFGATFLSELPTLLIFYGLYFGILGRDFAELCSDKMASTMGFTTKTGLPKRALEMNVCAICGNSLRLENGESIEPVFQLNCKHNYHESCIRGWTIVGKKETCPYCSEKVNLKQLFPSNPWTQQSLIWQQILNLLRYLIVWNPFIAIAVQIIIYVVDR